jgi:hypothetical protein
VLSGQQPARPLHCRLDIDPEYQAANRAKGKMVDREDLGYVEAKMAYGYTLALPLLCLRPDVRVPPPSLITMLCVAKGALPFRRVVSRHFCVRQYCCLCSVVAPPASCDIELCVTIELL